MTTELHGSITETIGAPAAKVFALVSDIDRLPEWNAVITRVVERPAELTRDAEWVVELRAMGNTWNSRSSVVEHDHGAMRFCYRTQTDDGNPSFAHWTWTVQDAGPESATVTVAWELHPKTFARRALLARVRHRQLRKEVRESLRAVERTLVASAEAR
jgi:uncharacterized protein YndB with AHSA1/START domain